MTAARRKKHGSGLKRLVWRCVAATALSCAPLALLNAAPTERVVVDRHTGLAIGGYDPVAYFTDGAARPGRSELELSVAGAVWRFRSEGNRAAFLADPEVYQPRFGGYDPVGVAEGRPVAGSARLWLVWGQRLYLFARDDNRAAFAADPARFLAPAVRNWPVVRNDLAD